MTNSLFLLSTSGCHLCELAEKELAAINVTYDIVDIVEDDKLVELYGDKIPVLMSSDAKQALFWPFAAEQIKQYVEFYGISSTQ